MLKLSFATEITFFFHLRFVLNLGGNMYKEGDDSTYSEHLVKLQRFFFLLFKVSTTHEVG